MKNVRLYSGIQDKLDILEGRLRSVFDQDDLAVQKVGEHILRSKGKRIRPLMLMLTAEMSGYEGRDDIQLGMVSELLHIATLVHDDILDNSETRRGVPTINTEWGNHMAVLLGDFLYTRAMREAIKLENIDYFDAYSSATLQLIGGELKQLYYRGSTRMTEEEHFIIIRKKTASLFSCCARLGGRLSGISEEKEQALAKFGMQFGIAFQLVDDLLDYTAQEETMGKPLFGDLKEGKITLPFIYLSQNGDPKLSRLLIDVIGRPDRVEEEKDTLRHLVNKNPTLNQAWDKARKFIEESRDILQGFPPHPARDALNDLAEFTLARNR